MLSCSATLNANCHDVGLVFGYVDRLNFWLRLYSKPQQKVFIYQVSNGTWPFTRRTPAMRGVSRPETGAAPRASCQGLDLAGQRGLHDQQRHGRDDLRRGAGRLGGPVRRPGPGRALDTPALAKRAGPAERAAGVARAGVSRVVQRQQRQQL